MPGLFAGTSLERPITCAVCERPMAACACPRDAAGNVLLPADQLARISLQKRKKGKMVTAIAGLDAAAANLPELLKSLKSLCGAGGTIDQGAEAPASSGSASAPVIELQGDQREKAAAHLRSLGYKVRIA